MTPVELAAEIQRLAGELNTQLSTNGRASGTARPAPPAERPFAPPADLEAAMARAGRILSGDVRPEDYLPSTPPVESRVERDMEWCRSRAAAHNSELDPVVERRQRETWLLITHFPNEHVAYYTDRTGTVVVMTGLARIGEFGRRFPTGGRQPVVIDYIDDGHTVYA